MEKNVYLIRWYGPFNNIDSAREWNKKTQIPCNLYLISGMKKHSKTTIHYYIGETERRFITNRFMDKGHHINDFSRLKEIWVGTFTNKKVTHEDIMTAEKMMISYFVGEVGENKMLNENNFSLPNTNVYVLSEWIRPHTERAWSNLPKSSPGSIMADVIVNKATDLAFNYYLYTSKKLKKQERK